MVKSRKSRLKVQNEKRCKKSLEKCESCKIRKRKKKLQTTLRKNTKKIIENKQSIKEKKGPTIF